MQAGKLAPLDQAEILDFLKHNSYNGEKVHVRPNKPYDHYI